MAGVEYADKKIQVGQDVTILGIRYDLVGMKLESQRCGDANS